eukprot:m.85053 g.85053  ORF g.85053 m.85053 type:complete len:71 (-) comp15041_c0_seq3:38-250(-)
MPICSAHAIDQGRLVHLVAVDILSHGVPSVQPSDQSTVTPVLVGSTQQQTFHSSSRWTCLPISLLTNNTQ